MQIKGKTATEVWRKILEYILDNGKDCGDINGNKFREILNITAVIEDPENIITPIEILNRFNKWVYPSYKSIKASILGEEDPSEYYYNYGDRAFNFKDINQINNYVIPLLKKNPASKRAVVMFYNPELDSFTNKKEIPGLVMVNFNIREGKIHTTMVLRSNDMFHGWTANIIQAYFLAEYIGKELNYPVGTISTHSISAHIFEEQFDDIKKVLGR